MTLLRLANRLLSPGGRQGRLTIMIFHRVLRERDPLRPYEPDAALFELRMRRVREWFNVLPLDVAVAELTAGALPARALAITFDDGYADNHDVALPVLRSLEMPATFFVATGYLDGGLMWNDALIEAVRGAPAPSLDLAPLALGTYPLRTVGERLAAIDALIGCLKYRSHEERSELALRVARAAGVQLPRTLMMTSAQVRALADAGMTVGAHTRHHPILAGLDDASVRDEMASSKRALECLLDRPVTLFAYPNGRPGTDYTADNVRAAREAGFTAACTTAPGVASPRADVFQLPRFTPWERSLWRYGARLSSNLRSDRYATV